MGIRRVKTRNMLLLGLCSLCALSLFGVGFASWNIIANEQKDGTGQIKTDADGEFVKSMGDYMAIENTENPVLGRYFFEPNSGTETAETSILSYKFTFTGSKQPSFLNGGSWFDLRCTFGVYDNEKASYLPLFYETRDLSKGHYASLSGVALSSPGISCGSPSFDDKGEYAYFTLRFKIDAHATQEPVLTFTLSNDLVLGVNSNLLSHPLANLRYRLRFSFGGSGQ